MKKIIVTTIMMIFNQIVFAQVGIDITSVDNSAVLELSNSKNKAFLPPRVNITSLLSITTPVANPVEGLIVYNIGTVVPKGYYIWNNGSWSLLATKENSVANLLVRNTSSTIMLAGLANNIYEPVVGGSTTFNSIAGASYNPVTGVVTVPPGNYSIQAVLSIQVPDENPSAGIGNTTRTHLHNYVAKLVDSTSPATIYGNIVKENQTSNSSASTLPKQHSVSFLFTVSVTTTTSFVLNLAHASGGTYTNTVGGNTPNNGRITVLNSFIHVQSSKL
ncbi:hypothetical protein NZ698_16870 [Chryseobacterium sp. PBS4-4]|uniref:DUF4402 domain-containing protein n=1 Tax=Chryseobacterium edaphi TaxID=2976532 RepID=A0ABT2WA30_9FLAO|nr:hypothetical protein [Chryseobacterium edaphi]MCU7618855.1 hypothetical protein [Chryseobacterium edaphi]